MSADNLTSQDRENEARNQIIQRLRDELEKDAKEVDFKYDFSRDPEILFCCKVERVPPYFDGSKSLTGTHVGDVVQVLKEHVGPHGMYHLCRLAVTTASDREGTGKDKIGWFPISHLSKINDGYVA
eukprot:CAMPEP_0172503420 /NCGR_PEP_ID=MMETSP1066-20121228/169012_1 /TAXON_ID=671091 /ORGANISM="Coscinodiscus wailesii, Strain CCMP2513" /LENGTH=125 /DNA_ID=CAMNT_0013279141 /DNA_START=236 /DNA_END=609 /DNA_ORIENTATION=+